MVGGETAPTKDGIQWHSGFQPLMAFNGSTLQKECLMGGALPLTNGLPPSHLGIVRKHPLLSVWRRFSEWNERLPLTYGLPPSHLGKVCKHPLLSVWRRFIAIQRPAGAIAILLRLSPPTETTKCAQPQKIEHTLLFRL